MSALATGGAGLLAGLALRGTVVLLAAAAAAFLLRRAPAAARHLVWGAALGGLLALPPLTLAVPAWRIPLPSAPAPAVVGGEPGEPVPGARPAGLAPADGGGAGIPVEALLLCLWGAGAAAVLLRLGGSVLRVRREARAACPLASGAWAEALDRLRRRLAIDRPVRLLEGGPDAMPLTWGIASPCILLPAGADAWPADRLEAVLLHELAHVRRRDSAWQIAAEGACALHWFNPLAWSAARRLRLEGELASDDHVLAAGVPGAAYAGHLLEVARTLRLPRLAAPGGIAMARSGQLRTRLGAVLAPARRGPLPRLAAGSVLAAAAALVALLASVTPVPAGAAAGSGALAVPAACRAAGAGAYEYDVVDGSGEWTVRWRGHGGCGGSARIRGVRFTPDLSGVAAVAPGGFLRIELQDAGSHTAAEVRPSRGRLVGTIRAGGGRVAWDARADAWLAAAIPELLRHTDYPQGPPGIG